MSNVLVEVPAVKPVGHELAEKLAQQTILDFDVSYLKNPKPFPVAYFWEFWLPKHYAHLRCRVAEMLPGLEGLTRPNGEILLSQGTYEAMNNDEGRARFTTMHECIHGILHVPQTSRMSCESYSEGQGPVLHRREDLPRYLDPEWQAHRIAGAVLMPAEAMKKLSLEAGMLTPEIVMATFDTSRAAASTRISQLQDIEAKKNSSSSPGRSRR